jgi:regulation of enolase protein 1 (concanavalin A-like superfamily)
MISANAFVAGTNVIAVEVHQASPATDDMSFDLQLSALMRAAPPPAAVSAPSGVTAVAPSQTRVDVSWVDTVSNENGFVIERSTDGANYAQVGTVAANATTYPDLSAQPSTAYWYRVRAFAGAAQSTYAGPAAVTTPAPTLPAPWVQADVGAVAAAGSGSATNGVFTVRGSGADIWAAADEFHYVYQPWSGNGTIIARVLSVQNTNSGAQGGVMFRESLAAGSKHAAIVLLPGGGVGLVSRSSTGGTSSVSTANGAVPYWLKLVRNGSTLTASTSANGSAWTALGSVTISMTSSILVGLLACSKNDGVVCTTTYDNVSVSGSAALSAAMDQVAAPGDLSPSTMSVAVAPTAAKKRSLSLQKTSADVPV